MERPTDPRSDQQLVRDISAGDSGAFEEIYWRYRDWVYGLAYRFTQHEEDALDVLQETFAYFSRKFPGFELTASLKTFFYPAVRNLSIEIRRKTKRSIQNEEALDGLPAPLEAAGSPSELALAVRNLPDGQREVLMMRFVDDLKLEEIATALEIPLGTVKSRLHKAIAFLREDSVTRKYFLDS